MDQAFVVWQVCAKYLANGKDVFWAFMDLEKADDKIDRHEMWHMLILYSVGGKLLKAMQRFHKDSRACVLVGMDVSEWFSVNVGLTQGCVMSPWLFNLTVLLKVWVATHRWVERPIKGGREIIFVFM